VEIKSTVLESLEEIYSNMPKFTAMVKEVSAPDLGTMGMEILSFTIRDVKDDVLYLESLGMSQTAAITHDADIGVAEANRDAMIRQTECNKETMNTKYKTDSKIEMNSKARNVEKASFETEVNSVLGTASLAYELEGKRLQQGLREAQMNIEVVERRKEIEIEEKEIERKEKELFSTVKIPAEAHAFKTRTIAEGMKVKRQYLRK
jgi:flotillin